MSTTTSRSFWTRQPLAVLGWLTVGALVGTAIAFIMLLLTILLGSGDFVSQLLIVAIGLTLVAALVASGLRWTPLLGCLAGLGTMIGGVFTQQYFLYHLTHPAEVWPFLWSLLIVVFALVAICAGSAATAQNYRGASRRAPRWLPTPLAALGGLVVGALLVALLVQATPASGNSTTTVNGVPAVHMGVSSFMQASVAIPKGSKLLLIDDGAYFHILSNGSWNGTTPRPSTESGAPALRNVQVNSGSIELGPFNTAGTFHIYCTVHPGMELTVIVQ